MDKLTAFAIVKAARTLIQGVNVSASDSTVAQYKAAFARMERQGLTPEKISGTGRSFFFYRAALVHHVASQIRETLAVTDRAAKQGRLDEWEHGVNRLEQLSRGLDRYKPDPDGKHLDQRVISHWAVEVEKRERAGQTIHSHSKRTRLRGLPDDWRNQMFENAKRSKYLDAIAVLAATGARPAELEKGITVNLTRENTLTFTIIGVKTHNGKYGQEIRKLEIAANSVVTKHLLDRVQEHGQLRIAANAGSLSDYARYLGKKTFPSLKKAVSAYCFRHQFAADLKAEGMESADVSAALGHCVDETQSYYASGRSARGSSGVQKVVGTREVREKTPEKMHQLSMGKSYEISLSR